MYVAGEFIHAVWYRVTILENSPKIAEFGQFMKKLPLENFLLYGYVCTNEAGLTEHSNMGTLIMLPSAYRVLSFRH